MTPSRAPSSARREREERVCVCVCVSARAKRSRARSPRQIGRSREETHQLLRKVVRNIVVIPVVLPPLRFGQILLGLVPLCERKEEFVKLVPEFPLLSCPSFKERKDRSWRGEGGPGVTRGLRSRAEGVTYLAFRTPRSCRPPRSSPAPRFACTRPPCPP